MNAMKNSEIGLTFIAERAVFKAHSPNLIGSTQNVWVIWQAKSKTVALLPGLDELTA